MSNPKHGYTAAGAIVAMIVCAGCSLAPKETDEQRQMVERVGQRYAAPFEKRALPELPPQPTWREILQRALLANGELEAAFFDWKAAVERVDAAGTWPNSDVAVGFSYMFSNEQMKSIDRATFSVANDASMNLSLPVKVRQQAKVALEEARAAGARLRVTKFDLQKKVLFAWADYTAQAGELGLKAEEATLLGMAAQASFARSIESATQADLMMSRVSASIAESQLADLRAMHESQRAVINAMLARDPSDPLVPADFGPPREIPEDADLLVAGIDQYPEVEMLMREVAGRQDALELARLRWIPDFGVSLSVTGTISQTVGAAVMLPTRVPEIRARINEAQAEVQAAEAVLRQRRADRIGEYVSLVITLRRAQQRREFFEKSIIPATERIASVRDQAYRAGTGTLKELLDARRDVLDARRTALLSAAQVEKSIVDIECCLGVDVETIKRSAPETASRPSDNGSPETARAAGSGTHREFNHEQ
jgi:outer membrane protein TolC